MDTMSVVCSPIVKVLVCGEHQKFDCLVGKEFDNQLAHGRSVRHGSSQKNKFGTRHITRYGSNLQSRQYGVRHNDSSVLTSSNQPNAQRKGIDM